MIERNRDKGMPFARLRMLIEGLRQPADQSRLLIIFVAVLEADNGFADLALGAVTGPGPFKMPLFLHAMIAQESSGMPFQRGIGITALFAEGRLDPHRLRLRTFGPRKGEIQGAFAPFPREGAGAVSCSGKMEGCR